MKKVTVYVLFLLTLITAPIIGHAEIIVSGTITTDTTWPAASGPYIVNGNITIQPGATLTVEPGAIVKLNPQRSITVMQGGTLTAHGTAEQPIYFTSYRDVTPEGGTNDPGNLPTHTDWGALVNDGTISLAHAQVRYAGDSYLIGTGAGVLNRGTLTLDHVTMHKSLYGVFQAQGILTTTNSTFTNNAGAGVHVDGGQASVGYGTFNGNTYAVAVTGGALNLTDATISQNERITWNANASFIHARTTFPQGFINVTTTNLSTNATFSAGDLSYLITNPLTIQPGATLTVEPGAIVKLNPQRSITVMQGGTLTAHGTAEQPIYFTSYRDVTPEGGTNDPGNLPTHTDWGALVNDGTISLAHAQVRYAGDSYLIGTGAGVLNRGTLTLDHVTMHKSLYGVFQAQGILTTTNSTFTNNAGAGVHVDGGQASVGQSSFVDNYIGLAGPASPLTFFVNAQNNWWGDASGPQHSTNLSGTGQRVTGNVNFTPWLNYDPINDACPQCSNIMFLPGLMGTEMVDGTGRTLWLSDNTTVDYLKMTEAGTSENNDVYAKRPLDEVFVLGAYRNIYKSFITDLQTWSGLYNIDSALVPYDWRLNYSDVVTKGRELSNGTISYLLPPNPGQDPYIIKTLKQLASTSKTGKVTIVAHSQGGLVAKALTNQLGAEASQYIDKIIFVATPHLGAPKAVAGLLHGTGLALPIEFWQSRVTNSKGRELGLTFPSAYNLLPSQKYFDLVSTPVVSFDANSLPVWAGNYGQTITSRTALNSFMGNEYQDRAIPALSDVTNPAVADSIKLNSSQTVHNTLDNWSAPNGVQTYAIAGWGLETIAGIEYSQKKECPLGHTVYNLSINTGQCDVPLVTVLKPKVSTAIEGDGTVPVVSAHGESIINRFWVDLFQRNTAFYSLNNQNVNRDHGDILEVSEIRDFVLSLIKNSSVTTYPAHITPLAPSYTIPDSKHFTLHSPLSLGFRDSLNRFIGKKSDGTIVNEIPNAQYEVIGESQWLSIPDDITGELVMQGTANGSFTLDIEQVQGNTVLSSTSFEAVPTLETTKVTVPIIANQSATTSATTLSLDIDGDDTAEEAISAETDGTIVYGQKDLTLTSDTLRIPLGSPLPMLTYTLSGFTGEDTQSSATTGEPLCTTPATSTSPIGSYPITCTVGSFTSTKYTISTFTPGTLTIMPTLTVSGNSVTIPQGTDIPPLMATITGFVNGDTQATATTGTPDCSTEATATSPIGTYSITCSIGTLTSDTYLVTTYTEGILTVLPKLTVTADDKAMIEGQALPTLTHSLSGFINGDTQANTTTGQPNCTTTATPTSLPGAYPITCTQGTLISNTYAITTFVDGTLVIEPAIVIHPLTITAHDKTMTQGSTIPPLTYTLSGFLNGDTAASSTTGSALCTTTATSTSPIGTYPISCTEGTLASATYSFADFIAGTLSITDGTPPELEVSFQGINTVLKAVDSFDEHPTYTKTGNMITLTDSDGNTTTITLSKYEQSTTKLDMTFSAITRNGATTSIPETTIKYEWNIQNNQVKELEAKVTLQGDEKYQFKYNRNKDETKIKVKVGNNTTTTTRTGLVTPTVTTAGSGVSVSY